jgi:GT2 family glycosyltransferase
MNDSQQRSSDTIQASMALRKTDASATAPSSEVGVIAIGRNEGSRLMACLRSVINQAALVVYVDSGSTDNSVDSAALVGAEVVALDLSTPFTAARARNEGFRRLRKLAPHLRHVQFVDGDCEMNSSWVAAASAFLESNPNVAVVCGRRRERFPERSIYNKLCDAEWNTPVGRATACGGDAMVRTDAFDRVGGYRANLIAGEEPELCLRLRACGWQVWRIDQEMTLHDANITFFSQWWRRMVRSGYAFAQVSYLHGKNDENFWVWESRRAWLWGFWIPFVSALLVLGCGPWGLMLLTIYPLQYARRLTRVSGSLRDRLRLAWFELIGRFPEAYGQLRFMRDRFLRRTAQIIEYK